MKHFLYSEAGSHVHNEDAASLRPHPDDPLLLIGALADGQGGRAGGARAAQIAVANCIERASACAPRQVATPTTWVDVCESADRAVARDAEAGFTTLIGVAVSQSFIVGASCGDSAVCLWTDGRLVILTGGQAKNPPNGSGAAHLTGFSALPRAPWRVLIVSDGVWMYAGWECIGVRLGSLTGEALIRQLRHDVLGTASEGLPDDFTAAIIES